MTPRIGDFVRRPYVTERIRVVDVRSNVVLINELGFYHTASLEAFKRGDYVLCD